MGMHDAMFFKVLEECMQLPSLFQGLRQVGKKKRNTGGHPKGVAWCA